MAIGQRPKRRDPLRRNVVQLCVPDVTTGTRGRGPPRGNTFAAAAGGGGSVAHQVGQIDVLT